jgi:hypothetical protein
MSQITSEPPNSYKALKFELEVSARYFDYRRSSLGVRVTIVRLISLLGSILSLLAISYFIESKEKMATVVLWISVFIGLANLVDLVFQLMPMRERPRVFFRGTKHCLGKWRDTSPSGAADMLSGRPKLKQFVARSRQLTGRSTQLLGTKRLRSTI